jgi:hypothetical protein
MPINFAISDTIESVSSIGYNFRNIEGNKCAKGDKAIYKLDIEGFEYNASQRGI